MTFYVALDDNLLRELHAFKRSQEYDVRTVEKMLHLYKPPHITNVHQLKRIGVDDPALFAQLVSAGFVDQSVEALAEQTVYKLILSSTSDRYPRLSVLNGHIGNNYAVTFAIGQSRETAHEWLQSLAHGANTIVIRDEYLATNWESTQQLFKLFPAQRLSVVCDPALPQEKLEQVKRVHPAWRLPPNRSDRYRSHHDRYILIDGRLEIIVTSGIDHLFKNRKECTIVVRYVRADQ
jgi:hypothetical protein